MKSESSLAAKYNILTLERNIPAAVTLELTRRCPLSCLHCYLPETRGRAKPAAELTTAQWKDILAQLAEAGALYLVFTGGEPLLRHDLPELCRYAAELRFEVRVYSTGLGLTGAAAKAFKDAGVSAFELSLYGRPETHDAVTGLAGSFERTLAAARLLKKSGLKVKLKTPLMKKNISGAAWLQALAKREGFEISFDPVLTAANDGDPSALFQRVSGRQLAKAVKLFAASPSPRFPIPDPRLSTPDPRPTTLDFLCGAGRNVCAVGSDGELYPCLQLQFKLGNLTRRSFAGIWKNGRWLKKWRRAGIKDLKGCAACPHADFCSRCPGVSLLEEGDLFVPNKPACEIAEMMHKYSVS